MLRRPEAELVAQVREALGADRFDEVFAADARPNRQEAVATVGDRATPTLGRPEPWPSPARGAQATKPCRARHVLAACGGLALSPEGAKLF
jgi:hypothetical protein